MNGRAAVPQSVSLLVWCVLGIVFFTSMWSYVFTVWPVSERGLSDLYPRWYGSRELLLHGRDPYASDITLEIQQWQHGRPARTGEDEDRFAYPVYVAFVLYPTVAYGFSAVSKAMFWLLLLCAAGSVIAYLRFVGWRPSRKIQVIVLLYSLSCFAVAFGARLGQLGLLVGLLLGACLLFAAANRLVFAGVLLALATIKPQLTVLIVPWMLTWAFSDWRHRRRFLGSFSITMVLLVAGSEILVRGWIRQFIASAFAYGSYTDGRSILELLLTRPGGIVVSIMLIGALAALCWKLRRAPADSPEFAYCSALVLATTLVVIPTMAPHGQVLLFPAIFLLIHQRQAIWEGGRLSRHALVATCAIAIWAWVAALGFWLLWATYGATSAHRFWLVPISASPIAPLSVALTLAIAKHQILAPHSSEMLPDPHSAVISRSAS
jgi:Glycosyltransferase family 87